MAWTLFAAGFTAVTLYAVGRLAKRVAARSTPRAWPRLALLRPCEGAEPHLAENLASSLAFYPGERRVFLLLRTADDPAAAIARALVGDEVELLVTHCDAPNRKAAQLDVGLRHALATWSPDLVAHADSDVQLDDDSLSTLVAALLSAPNVGAAFAAPVEPAVASLGDWAASGLLSASHHDFFALAALAQLRGGVSALAGALAVYRRAALETIGGFAPLRHLLGEDLEASRRLHAAGLTVEVAAQPVRTVDSGRALSAVVGRAVRWVTVVRRQRPSVLVTYPLLLAPTPLLLASLLFVAGATRLFFTPLLLLVLALRVALAAQLRRIHRLPVGLLTALGLLLGAELLMLVAWVGAQASSEVLWRGRRLRVGRGGVIVDSKVDNANVPSP